MEVFTHENEEVVQLRTKKPLQRASSFRLSEVFRDFFESFTTDSSDCAQRTGSSSCLSDDGPNQLGMTKASQNHSPLSRTLSLHAAGGGRATLSPRTRFSFIFSSEVDRNLANSFSSESFCALSE